MGGDAGAVTRNVGPFGLVGGAFIVFIVFITVELRTVDFGVLWRGEISRVPLIVRSQRRSTNWKHVCISLNLSMQSTPFGSSLLNTKQLNAVLNCSPHGPSAIPPRQGQSQLISPVSGLKAPCCPASSSSSSGPVWWVGDTWDPWIASPFGGS